MFCSFLELDQNDTYCTIAICYCKTVYKERRISAIFWI